VPLPMGALETGLIESFSFGSLVFHTPFLSHPLHTSRTIYDPCVPPAKNLLSKEQYTTTRGPTINHFYDKLLLIKDLMKTTAGRRYAEERHKFMETFLDRFYQEWNGAA
jgi:hypothetical protein